jgi:hypothetical protein
MSSNKIEANGWCLSSCFVQGKGHIKTHIPCQDRTKAIYSNGTYVIALSDGAGSAKLSHFGASCVVESICTLLTNQFNELFANKDGCFVKQLMIKKVLADIKLQAAELGCEVKDLAATMLAVAINEGRFIIAHVGDGVIGYLDNGTLKTASAPSNGEHANETYFVTSQDAISAMKLFKGSIKDIAGFVLMSDGTEQSLYNKRTNSLSPAIVKLMQRNIVLDHEAMEQQLDASFKKVIIANTQDDCSIAIISCEKGILHSFCTCSIREKSELYGIRNCERASAKRTKRYDKILDLLQKPATCRSLAKKLYLKPLYAKRHLRKLCEAGLVQKENGFYHSFIQLC